MAELTDDLIGQLAKAIPGDVMEKLAVTPLGISNVALKNIKSDQKTTYSVSCEILRSWSYKNPNKQIEV